MLSIIKSFHEGMSAVVKVGDGVTDGIEVTNGLRQGSTLAPTLFNLYFSAMVACWRTPCPQAGVSVRYRIGRKLVVDRTAKAKLKEVKITKSKFADDMALYATTREVLEQVATELVKTAAEWGLRVSLEKTKLLTVGRQLKPEDSLPVKLNEGEIGTVDDFTYLESNITRDGEVRNEVAMRLGKASRPFGCLRPAIFSCEQLSVRIKREVYCSMVLSTLFYGAETWAMKAASVRRLRGFHNRCIQSMLGVSRLQQWREKTTSRKMAETFGMTEDVTEMLRRHRLRWIAHIASMITPGYPSSSSLQSW